MCFAFRVPSPFCCTKFQVWIILWRFSQGWDHVQCCGKGHSVGRRPASPSCYWPKHPVVRLQRRWKECGCIRVSSGFVESLVSSSSHLWCYKGMVKCPLLIVKSGHLGLKTGGEGRLRNCIYKEVFHPTYQFNLSTQYVLYTQCHVYYVRVDLGLNILGGALDPAYINPISWILPLWNMNLNRLVCISFCHRNTTERWHPIISLQESPCCNACPDKSSDSNTDLIQEKHNRICNIFKHNNIKSQRTTTYSALSIWWYNFCSFGSVLQHIWIASISGDPYWNCIPFYS